MSDSPDGRRVLVAVVTGKVGETIQAWREQHDPEQALRLPPHATLCYWAPEIEQIDLLGAQVRHAFDRPIAIELGGVHEFDNDDGTFYIEVNGTAELTEARHRLFDGSHLQLQGRSDFTWHVTCVRYPDNAKREELRVAAESLSVAIAANPVWTIDTVAWLQLRDGIYQPLATWNV
ncbi:MAG TPA: 2'-5' RNA ligase family protein [Thermomicrobiales bacterium]|nr:2'-5' RNA ligase family protein [Thermomicrobiales bacterium]